MSQLVLRQPAVPLEAEQPAGWVAINALLVVVDHRVAVREAVMGHGVDHGQQIEGQDRLLVAEARLTCAVLAAGLRALRVRLGEGVVGQGRA